MSLCIAINKPGNFVIITGDGRITRENKVVSNHHPKLTKLTSHISIFSSGVQDYCEELRQRIAQKVNEHTSIENVAIIVQEESQDIHDQFTIDFPSYYEVNKGGAALATLIAFFDPTANECGFIEYCHSNDFIPHIVKGPQMQTRGLRRQEAMDHLLKIFNPADPTQDVLATYEYIESLDSGVGGSKYVHVLSKKGTDEYVIRG